MRNPPRPSGGSSDDSTPSTRAPSGPRRHHPIMASTAGASPSKTASTLPSGRLPTQPATPRSAASRAHVARKKTPWTDPQTRMRRRMITRSVGRRLRSLHAEILGRTERRKRVAIPTCHLGPPPFAPSALALRTVIGVALGDLDRLDRRAAASAREPGTVVHLQLLLVGARLAEQVEVRLVVQRRAAELDRLLQHLLDRAVQPPDLL